MITLIRISPTNTTDVTDGKKGTTSCFSIIRAYIFQNTLQVLHISIFSCPEYRKFLVNNEELFNSVPDEQKVGTSVLSKK